MYAPSWQIAKRKGKEKKGKEGKEGKERKRNLIANMVRDTKKRARASLSIAVSGWA